jgi:hypothetical protein
MVRLPARLEEEGSHEAQKRRLGRCDDKKKDDEEQQKNNLSTTKAPPRRLLSSSTHLRRLPWLITRTGLPCLGKERCSVVGGRCSSSPLPGPV